MSAKKNKQKQAKIRSFIAIDLPEDLKEELKKFQSRLKKSKADVKWVRPESMHITLRFLGYLTPEEIEKAKTAINTVAKRFAPFQIQVRGWGTFPEKGRPRVIWTGLEQGAEILEQIFNQLEKELVKLGFDKADKKFVPHLTLGRIKTSKNLKDLIEYLNKEGTKTYGNFWAEKIILFKSDLKPEGAIYSIIKDEPFSAQKEG